MVFTLFDVGGGVVKQSKINSKTKGRSWSELQRFTVVTTANYKSFVQGVENEFELKPEGVMSMTDVYKFVQAIGAGSEKGTLVELSFFSHGWVGGPILVNSFETSKYEKSGQRDPKDKDARKDKDFNVPNMDAAALANFRAAFAATGIVWTWGCNFQTAARTVLLRFFRAAKNRQIPPRNIKDTDRFVLDFFEDEAKPTEDDDFNIIVNKILPGGKLSGRNYTVPVTLAVLRNSFNVLMADTYSARIASATGATTFGALPGTSAIEEIRVPLPLMRVPTSMPVYRSDQSQVLDFYRFYMNVRLDPEDRGYGTFIQR